MFTDERKHQHFDRLRQQGLQAASQLLTPELFAEVEQRSGIKCGKNPLSPSNLVWLGIMAAIESTHNFADVLQLTLKWLHDSGQWQPTPTPKTSPAASSRQQQPAAKQATRPSAPKKAKTRSKHDPRGSDPQRVTEEAFAQARQKMPLAFWLTLLLILSERIQKQFENVMRWKNFRVLALDGTMLPLPNQKALRKHYGSAKNGRSRGSVMSRMVMLNLALARVPLAYRSAPLSTGERTLATQLTEGLQRNDLLLLDAGFWSYGLFQQIHQQGAFFGIRLSKAFKNYKVTKRISRHERIVKWRRPNSPAWRKAGLPEFLDLRVIDYQMPGFRPTSIVTNCLDSKAISRADWVQVAERSGLHGDGQIGCGLYHRRWEIETHFYELKITQRLVVKKKSMLRSRTPEGIEYELAGHMVLNLLLRYLMLEAAAQANVAPLAISFSGALRELSDMQPFLVTATPQQVRRVLLPKLLQRIASRLVPYRPGRSYPRPADGKTKNLGNGKYKISHKLAAA
jgi:hypothetical protein